MPTFYIINKNYKLLKYHHIYLKISKIFYHSIENNSPYFRQKFKILAKTYNVTIKYNPIQKLCKKS